MPPEIISQALGPACAEDADPGMVATESARALCALLDELRPLVGESATQALLARALHLARSDFVRPAVGLSAAQAIVALQRDLGTREPGDARAAARALLQAFGDLLVSLIGEPLTHRMLDTAWRIPSRRPPSPEQKR